MRRNRVSPRGLLGIVAGIGFGVAPILQFKEKGTGPLTILLTCFAAGFVVRGIWLLSREGSD